MYAIIETGGKQYRVEPGDTLDVERIATDNPDPIEFDRVLAVSDGDDLRLGTPLLDGAVVSAQLVKQFRGKKLVVFKMKRRKGYRLKKGHRQELTRVRIVDIKAGAEPKAKAAPAEPEAKAEAAPAKAKAVAEPKAKPKAKAKAEAAETEAKPKAKAKAKPKAKPKAKAEAAETEAKPKAKAKPKPKPKAKPKAKPSEEATE